MARPSQSHRCASTPGTFVRSTFHEPHPISGVSRRRLISLSIQLSSDPGSRRWVATFTPSGPNRPSTTGRRNRERRALENPPFSSSFHCIGVRTARRPGMSRFSPIPISSP